jgi:signal transduction histidine kinase
MLVGTANGGVNIYDPKIEQFKFLNLQHGLTNGPVWSILKTEKTLWLGTDNGIYQIMLSDNPTKTLFASQAIRNLQTLTHPWIAKKRICALFSDTNDRLIIGTADAELIRIHTQSKEIERLELSTGSVVAAIQKRANTIWLATHNGIYHLNEELEVINHFDNKTLGCSYFLSSYQSKDGTLWFGGNTGFVSIKITGEINHFQYNSETPEKSPAFNFITGFYEDSNGKIWMATYGGGISIYDRLSKRFEHISKTDGLCSNITCAITGDANQIFVSTSSGISKIDAETYEITNFGRLDGLIDEEFAINSFFKSKNEIYFGTTSSLVVFQPDSLFLIESVPKPTVTSLSINYKNTQLSIIRDNSLDLYPGDRTFSLKFAGLGLRKVEDLKYLYRMHPFDKEWVETDAFNRLATYSLTSGKYSFQVKSKLAGNESDIEEIKVEVHPYFYQTTLFWAFIGLLTIGLTILTVRYYSHRSLKERLRKLELKQKIQAERERISHDLHDNVGSQITYITSSIDHLSRNIQNEELKELGDFARDTMRQLRETIWVINHDEVTVQELKTKVIEFLSEVLKPHPRIIHKVDFEDSDIPLVPSDAINLFRIIQEAVNNSLKHASPGELSIKLTVSPKINLSISDDGCGFNGKDKSGHFGLLIMRKRAKELGAEFSLHSFRDTGTTIQIRGIKIGQMA